MNVNRLLILVSVVLFAVGLILVAFFHADTKAIYALLFGGLTTFAAGHLL